MAKKHDQERIAQAFREAEASSALEGIDPSGPAYDRAKALLIEGKISVEEGIAMITEEARKEFPQKGAA
jgi:hypothetical protein